MHPILTVIISVLVFGFLIFIHEFGHYITARIFKVKINEFSIGMGPRIFSRTSKKTGIKYSLAALPIGGFVAMAGEDEETDEPDSFDKKPAWQRFIITFAGAAVNIFIGVVAMSIFTAITPISNTTIDYFVPMETTKFDVTTEGTLKVGDTIVEVDGRRVNIFDELNYEIMRKGHEPVDIVVIRDGRELLLKDVVFPTVNSEGETFGMRDFILQDVDKTFGSVVYYSFSKSFLIVRMCWESLFDLITGRYSLNAVSGPIGISTALGEATSAGIEPFLYLFSLISINLGVMNLMPIPALDGGRLIITLFEMTTRKRLPRKIENAINAVGLALLLGLSVVIMIKDAVQLII